MTAAAPSLDDLRAALNRCDVRRNACGNLITIHTADYDTLRAALQADPVAVAVDDPFAFVEVTKEYAELHFPRKIRKGPRGNRMAGRELGPGIHPLYLTTPPATTLQATGSWLDKALSNSDLVGPAWHFRDEEEVIQVRTLRALQRQHNDGIAPIRDQGGAGQ